jgi:hypothetical protein
MKMKLKIFNLKNLITSILTFFIFYIKEINANKNANNIQKENLDAISKLYNNKLKLVLN